MKKLTVFFPACGGEPVIAVIRALRTDWAGPGKLRIICADTDLDKRAVVDADRFVQSPRRADSNYLRFLLETCAEHKVDVLWPNPTEEQLFVSAHRKVFASRGIRLLLPPDSALKIFADKRRTYQRAAALGLRVPRWLAVKDWNGLCKAAEKLGYPERTVVLRRKTGKGAIGLRILTEDPRLGSHVFNRQPDGKMIPLGALKYFIARHKNWPPCMVTEYLPGREFDVDCFCSDDGLEVAATRRNDAMLHGSSWRAVTVDRPDLADSCRRLLDSLRWKYVCSVTFREDEAGIPALLEVNGRMPSSINLTWKAGCNLPLAALLLCAGQPRLPQSSPRPGVRMVRYFAESFLFP